MQEYYYYYNGKERNREDVVVIKALLVDLLNNASVAGHIRITVLLSFKKTNLGYAPQYIFTPIWFKKFNLLCFGLSHVYIGIPLEKLRAH